MLRLLIRYFRFNKVSYDPVDLFFFFRIKANSFCPVENIPKDKTLTNLVYNLAK